jgi:hypothetical protein
MGKAIIAAALAAFLSISCSSARKAPTQVEDIPHELYDACRINEMAEGTGAVHIWYFPEPIRVRKVSGRIIFEGWDGSWYENTWPILKLRGPWKSQRIYEVHGDAEGHFELKHLPEGQFCFFASASCSGYHGYMGIIIINKKADKTNKIEIMLPFAVP